MVVKPSILLEFRNPKKLQEFKKYYQKEHPQIRNYTLCILGLNTALRITDILQLKWGDIYDFSRGKLVSHITVTEQKTGKSNVIVLNESARDALTYYMISLSSTPAEYTFLFPSRKGCNRPIGRCQAFRIVKEAAQAVGLERHISCHSLRKTFGYYAWQQGIEQDDKDNVFMKISI